MKKKEIHFLWSDRYYLVRAVTVLTILAIMAVRDFACVNPIAFPTGLFVFGIAYPHLLQLFLGRFEGSRLRTRYSLLVDGFFAGAIMPALAFGAIPCFVILAINLFNWTALGGTYLLFLGTIALLAGIGISGLLAGFQLAPSPCVEADFLSGVTLVAYFVLVAWIVHRRSSALQKHCERLQAETDGATMNRRRAEQALLAVLPYSVSLEHSNGGVRRREIADATLLLGDFALPAVQAGDTGQLRTLFNACDEILQRHGMEPVKTLGKRYLAMATQDHGPENALVAALEIAAFIRDHGIDQKNSPDKAACVRLAIHCGPIVAGMIQPEKFSYDVFGDTVDTLILLLDENRSATILISEAARSHLQREWRLMPLPGAAQQPVFTPVEHGRA